MSRRRWLVRGLLALGSGAVLVAAAALARAKHGGTAEIAMRSMPAAASRSSAKPEIVTYCVGYALAMALTLAAFALVHWQLAKPTTALGLVFALALVQIVVHFRCFLHVTLRGSARDDLQLILFSTLIVALMVGGTLVVLFNLRMRMM